MAAKILDESTLEKIFCNLTDRYGVISGEVREIIGILIRITLKFRDSLVREKETPLTVEKTQKALDALLTILQRWKVPTDLPARVATLVNLWLDEIKLHTFH